MILKACWGKKEREMRSGGETAALYPSCGGSPGNPGKAAMACAPHGGHTPPEGLMGEQARSTARAGEGGESVHNMQTGSAYAGDWNGGGKR